MMRSWTSVAQAVASVQTVDLANGASCAQSRLRLFGGKEETPRVTLFRDHHAWCPYCQKVWLWLEEKRVPYRVEKVTMFCYGDKEKAFLRKVPSGMLPAIEIDGELITESDVILEELEARFGPLGGARMNDDRVVKLRRLERMLFSAWCEWLCRRQPSKAAEDAAQLQFERTAMLIEEALGEGPFFLGTFSTADVVFVPYVERMSASLLYYKGFALRDAAVRPRLCAWFTALEKRLESYGGTQSDFHTHAHDLPPQMGGCYESGTEEQQSFKLAIDRRGGDSPYDKRLAALETTSSEPSDASLVAARQLHRHRAAISEVNPECNAAQMDAALLAVAANLLGGEEAPPKGTAAGLRYVRDRVSVPRDMPLWSARRLCAALEATASLDSDEQPKTAIALKHRRDQNPRPFRSAVPAS